MLKQATECRLAGNAEARSGNLARAVELYTAGLEASAQRGRHLLLANRAGARLALGDAAGAAADADEAAALAPPGFTTCYVRQARVFALRKAYVRTAGWPPCHQSCAALANKASALLPPELGTILYLRSMC